MFCVCVTLCVFPCDLLISVCVYVLDCFVVDYLLLMICFDFRLLLFYRCVFLSDCLFLWMDTLGLLILLYVTLFSFMVAVSLLDLSLYWMIKGFGKLLLFIWFSDCGGFVLLCCLLLLFGLRFSSCFVCVFFGFLLRFVTLVMLFAVFGVQICLWFLVEVLWFDLAVCLFCYSFFGNFARYYFVYYRFVSLFACFD